MAAFESEEARDAFLAKPRLAILMTNREDAAPIGVPVWCDWDGTAVQIFAAKGSPKLKRIERDPRVSVMVTNHVGEPEGWVAFDGVAEIKNDGVGELITKLAPRYWDMSNPTYKDTIDSWVANDDAMVRIEMVPERIRSGA